MGDGERTIGEEVQVGESGKRKESGRKERRRRIGPREWGFVVVAGERMSVPPSLAKNPQRVPAIAIRIRGPAGAG